MTEMVEHIQIVFIDYRQPESDIHLGSPSYVRRLVYSVVDESTLRERNRLGDEGAISEGGLFTSQVVNQEDQRPARQSTSNYLKSSQITG